MRTIYLALVFVALTLLATRNASAQAAARTGFGAGAEATNTGIVGGTVVYDAGVFHVDGLLGANFASNDKNFAVAGRLFFPIHRAQSADFSVGPGLGLVHNEHDQQPPATGSNSNNEVHVEAAAQIRAFLVSNVAFSASLGLGAKFASGNNSVSIGGQVGGALGVTYFFF